MTYEEARALIAEHLDYGGSLDSHALAVAISASGVALESRVLAERKPVAWAFNRPGEDYRYFTTDPERDNLDPSKLTPLFTHPTPDDARDAARYRWLKENAEIILKESRGFMSSGRLIFSTMPAVDELDAAIDGIIEAEKQEAAAIDAAMQADKETK